jgi:hypothetical protein
MPDIPHCTDCGAALKGVPSWMATAKVNFTCAACPRRSSRGAAARLDTPIEARSSVLGDTDIEVEDIDEIEEDSDTEMASDDLEELKDDDL